jgi:hypothetical protein
MHPLTTSSCIIFGAPSSKSTNTSFSNTPKSNNKIKTYIQTSIMPKISKRKQTIKHLSKVCYWRLLERFQRDDDSSDEDSLEDDLDLAFMSRLEHVRSKRYLSRGTYRKSKGRKEIIAEDLQEENNSDGERTWLTAGDFKWKYRVDREESFWLIHDLIKDHDVFKKKGPRGRPQTDVKTQLCVFLRFLGTEGSGASNHGQRSTFRVSYGFAARCRTRVARAICSLAPQYITWPDEQEQKQISKAFFELSQLSN